MTMTTAAMNTTNTVPPEITPRESTATRRQAVASWSAPLWPGNEHLGIPGPDLSCAEGTHAWRSSSVMVCGRSVGMADGQGRPGDLFRVTNRGGGPRFAPTARVFVHIGANRNGTGRFVTLSRSTDRAARASRVTLLLGHELEALDVDRQKWRKSPQASTYLRPGPDDRSDGKESYPQLSALRSVGTHAITPPVPQSSPQRYLRPPAQRPALRGKPESRPLGSPGTQVTGEGKRQPNPANARLECGACPGAASFPSRTSSRSARCPERANPQRR
jgi:hypothetical protein